MKRALYRFMVRWNHSQPLGMPAHFEEALIRAATPGDCWDIIRSVAPAIGASRIRLRLAGRSYEWKSDDEPTGAWELDFDLSPDDQIRLTRHTLTPITPFLETLRQTLAPKLPIFHATLRKY